MARKLFNHNPIEVYSKYQELGTLERVANYYNFHIETIRQFFIKNDLEYIKRQKYDVNHNFFSEDNEKSFYWAGFLAADGNIEKDSNRIKLELQSGDKNHVEKFKYDIKSTAPIQDYMTHETRPQFLQDIYYSATIRFNSEKMTKDLLRFGITPAKSHTFAIDDFVLNHQYFRHFIRGLIDGDGGIYTDQNNSHIVLYGTFACTTAVCAHLSNQLCITGGSVRQNKETLYCMGFRRLAETTKIIHYLYDEATVWLDRKKAKADRILLCKPRKLPVNKDILEESMIRNHKVSGIQTYKAVSLELGISVGTIRRRLKEFGLIWALNC